MCIKRHLKNSRRTTIEIVIYKFIFLIKLKAYTNIICKLFFLIMLKHAITANKDCFQMRLDFHTVHILRSFSLQWVRFCECFEMLSMINVYRQHCLFSKMEWGASSYVLLFLFKHEKLQEDMLCLTCICITNLHENAPALEEDHEINTLAAFSFIQLCKMQCRLLIVNGRMPGWQYKSTPEVLNA